MSEPQLVVLWRVTEVCDLACPFCAYSRTLRRSRHSVEASEVLAFGRVLSKYARLTNRDVMMSWLGGEPLFWKPLFELSPVFKQDFGLRLGLTTNGTRLNDAMVRQQLLAHHDEITVSVDGIDHDKYRHSAGLFARLEENVKRLVAERTNSKPRLRINTILMRDNVEIFEDLCEAVASWGVDELTFNALGGRDRPEYFPDHRLQPEQLERFRRELPKIRERMAGRGLTILGSDHYLERLQATAGNGYLAIDECNPGQQFLFINEQGVISPCSFTSSEYGVHVSEIKTADDLQALPNRFAQRRRERLATVCYDCPSTQVFGKFTISPMSI
jgi:MoaA/NifB/PqqE/SkfB family radical SAM enzyme